MRQGTREIVVTDTVGFIRDLPKDLFAAFRATFEEASDADLLLQVADGADPACEEHLRTTEKLLDELGLAGLARLLVLNKSDLLPEDHVQNLAGRYGGVAISARDPNSLELLRHRIGAALDASAAALPAAEAAV